MLDFEFTDEHRGAEPCFNRLLALSRRALGLSNGRYRHLADITVLLLNVRFEDRADAATKFQNSL